MVQWLRIHLPMQGTQVQSPFQEDPTYCRATEVISTLTSQLILSMENQSHPTQVSADPTSGGYTDRQIHRQTDTGQKLDQQSSRMVDRQMTGWMDESMKDRQITLRIYACISLLEKSDKILEQIDMQQTYDVGGGLVAKSCLTLVTPQTVAHQAPLSKNTGWSRLPCPSPRGSS